MSKSKTTPLSPERFALQCTIDQSDYENLEYAKALLGHQVPSGDVAQVIKRALETLVRQLEKQKFAATSRPRTSPRREDCKCAAESSSKPATGSPRYVSRAVKRAVWERDQGQCTFKSDTGQRCPARTRLEFDHVEPVALGGKASVNGLRLRCRAHNQLEAERVFGTEFMEHKREEGRARRAEARVGKAASEQKPGGGDADAAPETVESDVTPWLRRLGFHPNEARRAAAYASTIPDATLEERVRRSLAFLRPSTARFVPAPVARE